ncbi:5-(carboxyamino)imidazole ribonucleotide synthase [candidate division KSB1 bacterium]|nr:5-(carboxyamino)imidazole ribonucleotide synthase [candidate division KSB1 bacterium]
MKLGVLGGGQLGRMIGLAGLPLGLQFRFFDPIADSPAQAVGEFVCAAYSDESALAEFGRGLEVVTYEFENVPDAAAKLVAAHRPVYPATNALTVAQDRLQEKQLFESLEIPTPKYVAIETPEQLPAACETVGYPAVVKTRRLGYDGKGQVIVRSAEDHTTAARLLESAPCLVEQFIPFQRELSILAVRSRSGEADAYPPVENLHRDGILRRTIAPAPDTPAEVARRAAHYATLVMRALDYVGVICLELFEWDGRLYANEVAPRVHNSGHWTIEGAETSQFENHLRAILGWPLGSCRLRGAAAMLNIIGSPPETSDILKLPDVHLHLYGKSSRPNRKIGHVTICAEDGFLLHTLLHEPALQRVFNHGE